MTLNGNRLMVIDPGLRLWGSERALMATLAELAADWNQVCVVTPPDAELAGALQNYPVTALTAPIGDLHRQGRLVRLRALWHLARLIRRRRVDQIYLNQAGMCRIVQLLAWVFSLPLVIHVRLAEDLPRVASLRSTPRVPLTLILVSDNLKRLYSSLKRPDQPPRAITAYDPVERDWRAKLSQSPDRDIACVGRLSVGKGQAVLVQAMAMLPLAARAATLDIIGAGIPGDPFAADLDRQVAQAELGDQVRMLGFRDDVESLLPRYRVLAVPSHYESLGLVTIEAWAAGILPVASAESGGTAELIGRSGGGILYPGHAAEALADALERALAMTPAQRAGLIAKGRNWAAENLSLAQFRDSLSGVLFHQKGSA